MAATGMLHVREDEHLETPGDGNPPAARVSKERKHKLHAPFTRFTWVHHIRPAAADAVVRTQSSVKREPRPLPFIGTEMIIELASRVSKGSAMLCGSIRSVSASLFQPVATLAFLLLLSVGEARAAGPANSPSPVIESKTLAGMPPGSKVTVIDGVAHGLVDPPNGIRFVYGVPVQESVGPAAGKRLTVGGIDAPSERIAAALAGLPTIDLKLTVARDGEGGWIRAPFDGIVDAGCKAMCPSASNKVDSIFRTKSGQPGTAPLAPRIADFPTLDKLRASIIEDMDALGESRPWQPESCDIDLEKLAAGASAALKAYVAAWSTEQPASSKNPGWIKFDFAADEPLLSDIAKPSFWNELAAIERDIQELPDPKSDRMKAALSGLGAPGTRPIGEAMSADFKHSLVLFEKGWLTAQCREILYAVGAVPTSPYIYRQDIRSRSQLLALFRIWSNLATTFGAEKTNAERWLHTSGLETVDDLSKVLVSFDSNTVVAEPPTYLEEDLHRFRLISGDFTKSNLEKQAQMALLTQVVTFDENKPRNDPNRGHFDPRHWRVIEIYHASRLKEKFLREFHHELFQPTVSSALRFTALKQDILDNAALAREFYGKPADVPWHRPLYARDRALENRFIQSGDKSPAWRWYDDETLDSTLVLSADNPILANKSDYIQDSRWGRFLSDMDGAEWAIYNRTVNDVLTLIDREISRLELSPGYLELENTLRSLRLAEDNQRELVFGGEPFRIEECAAALQGKSFVAGDMLARVRPAYRHLLEFTAPGTSPLLQVLAIDSAVAISFTSLVASIPESGASNRQAIVSSRSTNAGEAFVAASWARAAVFPGRVIAIERDGGGARIVVEVTSRPEQDVLHVTSTIPGLTRFLGVTTSGPNVSIELPGGILGSVLQATAVLMPRSSFEIQKLQSNVDSVVY